MLTRDTARLWFKGQTTATVNDELSVPGLACYLQLTSTIITTTITITTTTTTMKMMIEEEPTELAGEKAG